MVIGIDSFAAILPHPTTGATPSPTDRIADLLDEVEIADPTGLDIPPHPSPAPAHSACPS